MVKGAVKMSKKTIMLVCSAGMSTSLLVTKMQKAAFNQGLDAHIFAASASELRWLTWKTCMDVK